MKYLIKKIYFKDIYFLLGSGLNCTVCEDALSCGENEEGMSQECEAGWMCGTHNCDIGEGETANGRICMNIGDLNGLLLEHQCTFQVK